MVSGLVTSPWDQLRIFSGDASEMRMESKSAIRLARSYGEERYILSPIKCLPSDHLSNYLGKAGEHAACLSINPPPAPFPAFHAASSLIPRPDTATVIRESAR